MTHGEAWYQKKLLIAESHGLDDNEGIKGIPKPLPRKEAGKYYNTKLFAYWMDKLDDRLSIKRKKQLISALMFGHTDRYKHFKELA